MATDRLMKAPMSKATGTVGGCSESATAVALFSDGKTIRSLEGPNVDSLRKTTTPAAPPPGRVYLVLPSSVPAVGACAPVGMMAPADTAKEVSG